ncbi:MAG: RES family NAD+ phosphorylase [Bdellovibrionaceae bacterium]|nr:RES family NAD+ phosphorylase [Pseudobdellovibrionaceae bacterium]
MSRKKHSSQFIPRPQHKKIPSIDELLNQYFESEDGENKKLQDFFKAYYGFLQKSREEKLEEIVDALSAVADTAITASYTRIVQLKYGDPLSVVGSLAGPGGRFNIGNGMGHTKPFACLYVANDFHTAFCECYHYPPGYMRGNVDALKMALQKPSDFMTVQLGLNIEKCIDLRNKDNLRGFTQVISDIKPTDEFKLWAKDLGYFSLRTIQTHGELYRTLLDPDFVKNYYSLDMPSNSQWFGYYCLMAGIQGIIFPSVRDKQGYNIAVLVDNLKDTESSIKIEADTPVVPDDRKVMNGDNFEFFKIKIPTKKILN